MSEQSHNRLCRLGAHAETGGAETLPCLQHQHIGAFFVHVGQSQVVGAALQDIGHGGDVIKPCGQDGAVAGEALGVGTHGGGGGVNLVLGGLDACCG